MFNAIKILGVYYSYYKNFESQESFINLVLKTEKLLRLWRMRSLSIAGKFTVFKTLAISKIVHLALVKVIQNSVILELESSILKLNRAPFIKIMEMVVSKTLILPLK